MTLRLSYLTLARSDYDRMRPLLDACDAHPAIDCSLILGPGHQDPRYGATGDAVIADGRHIRARCPAPDEDPAPSRILAGLQKDLARHLGANGCDCLMVFGDRYELLAAANHAVLHRLPLLHLCGGEVTAGAIDDQVRHMLTKAAHLHAVAHPSFGRRLQAMGEETWRIAVTGSPAIDALLAMPTATRSELDRELGCELAANYALVTYHPATLDPLPVEQQIAAVLDALAAVDGLDYLITYPGADPGSAAIITAIESFAANHRHRVHCVPQLGQRRFVQALHHARLVLGNSSSGIVEAPSFGVPTVDIGPRQADRLAGASVRRCPCATPAIIDAIETTLRAATQPPTSTYGDGQASPRIIDHLLDRWHEHGHNGLLAKRFIDLQPESVDGSR